MKNLFYGALALLVPVALVILGVKNIGGNAAMVFGCFALLVLFAFTYNCFKPVDKVENYKSSGKAFCEANVGNAIIVTLYLFLTLVGARVFYISNATPLGFTPLMFAAAYCCLQGIVMCVIRLIKDKSKNAWQKAHISSLLAAACCAGLYCLCEAVAPYGIYFPKSVENIICFVIMLSVVGIIVCGYKFTVYDVHHA